MADYKHYSDISEMKQFLSEQLPDWEKATAEILLTTFSHSDKKAKNSANANNWLWWLFYRIPGKEELKRRGLMY